MCFWTYIISFFFAHFWFSATHISKNFKYFCQQLLFFWWPRLNLFRARDAECRAIITGTADRRRSKKVSFKLRLAHVPHSPGVKEMLPHPKTKTWTMSEVPSTIIMYDCYKKPTHMGSRKKFPKILKHFPTMSGTCLPIHSTNPTIHSPMKEGEKAQLHNTEIQIQR